MKILIKAKNKIHSVLYWKTIFGDLINKVYDLNLFFKYRFTEDRLMSQANHKAFLIKQYHIVEKGLALPSPKKAFGKLKIEKLIEKSLKYKHEFGDDSLLSNIRETLTQYLNRNEGLKDEDEFFYEMIISFLNGENSNGSGGVKKINTNYLKKTISIDFESFVKSRSSVRNFSTDEVLDSKIIKAVDIARFAPSVCNRQSWRVHCYKDEKLKERILKLQAGNSGFTKSINKLLIVTTDLRYFTKLESNQIFIDGGLFSMNLLLSLHSLGIGSCCLNTCVPASVENSIKSIGNIPKYERLIMMIGVGELKPEFEVAISEKIKVEDILFLK